MTGRQLGLAAALLLAVAGCAPNAAPTSGSSSSAAPVAITVFAAASLTEAFTALGPGFEAAHPGQTVRFSFGSSATLANQIVQGAPADVFAAASPATMRTVSEAGVSRQAVEFAANTLQIAVPPGNPGKVSGLADFADADKTIAICAPSVPCGAAAEAVFAAAGITPRPDTLEQDVKATLQKVAANEVDAGLVYTTDVQAAGDDVEGIRFAEAERAVNRYPIAVLTSSQNAAGAQGFVDYVLSADGQRVLAEAGFVRP